MKRILNKVGIVLCAATMMTACSLEEYNPGGGTGGNNPLASFEKWSGMQTQCYEPIHGQIYATFDFTSVAELGTDIWVCQNNRTWAQQFFYYEGLTTSTNASKKVMLQAYTMINTCNSVINNAANVIDGDATAVKTLTAEAKFLRAFYYSILVTHYGNITLNLNSSESGVNYRPQRSSYEELYAQMVKDLKEAAADLPVEPYNGERGRATKKSALGLLARVYAQGAGDNDLKEDGVSYWQRAKEVAEDMVQNAAQYGCKLYDDVEDLWAQANNKTNEEALFVANGPNPAAGNSENLRGNNNFGYQAPNLEKAGSDIYPVKKNSNYLYGRYDNNVQAPSKYLIDLFDARYDKRWEQSFTTAFGWATWVQTPSWGGTYTNPKHPKWTEALIEKYSKDASLLGKEFYPLADFEVIDQPLSPQYVAKEWPKGDHSGDVTHLISPKNIYVNPYPVDPDDDRFVFYLSKDRLSDTERAARMQVTINIDDLFDSEGKYWENATQFDGGKTNTYQLFPALTKYNWNFDGAYSQSNLQKKCGDTFILRLAEMYLIAAEANQKLGDGAKAAQYLNALKKRAARSTAAYDAMKLSTATEQDVLDEFAREMCGEFYRFGLLKRHHCLKEQLQKGNIRAYRNFDEKKHYLRPISDLFLNQIENADEYGTNGY